MIVANADLLKSRIRNLGRMPEQRALFGISISYETPPDKVDAVSALIRDAVAGVPEARLAVAYSRACPRRHCCSRSAISCRSPAAVATCAPPTP